jgi:hypothetical protein
VRLRLSRLPGYVPLERDWNRPPHCSLAIPKVVNRLLIQEPSQTGFHRQPGGVSLICPVDNDEGNLLFKESIMSNRVLNRRGARELTAEEIDRIAGCGSLHTLCGVPPHFFRDDASGF